MRYIKFKLILTYRTLLPSLLRRATFLPEEGFYKHNLIFVHKVLLFILIPKFILNLEKDPLIC